MRRGADPRTAAEKLLAVLESFMSDASDGLSVSEISKRTGLSMSTTFRLVRDWVNWGGLAQKDPHTYVIGTRLWEVGVLNPNLQGVRTTAIPFLDDLAGETGQTAQLAILDKNHALYIEKMQTRNDAATRARLGARLPLHATGVGLVLLAHAGDPFIERYLQDPLASYTPHTLTDPQALRSRLEEIRREGVAWVNEEFHVGVLSVASPVRDRTGQVIAAVSVAAPANRPENSSMVPIVRMTALGISRGIGYRKY